ncbi:MAG TPA: serine/threonine-protein kinase [Ktedonobacteraceae bacterium]|nr:serine/threonine-protein kinase [Ktedonobacteraceae bacterium]
MADYVGQQFGNYRLIRLIETGDRASILLGQHVRLWQKFAAVKIPHAHISRAEIEAFQCEAEIIAALHHPHIVNVLDFDMHEGTPFLVMDYYPDGSLHERHPSGTRVPLPTVLSYVQQVAKALHYIHNHQLVHGNVKAANMLIGWRGELLLSDFRLATFFHSRTATMGQDFVETTTYMAPEQIALYARPESDQYSLAVVTYEWLTGKLPFDGTQQQIALQHLVTPPESMLRVLPDLAPEVDQVILKALQKNPQERFPTILAFATALEEAAQPKQPEPVRPTTPLRSETPPRLAAHGSAAPQAKIQTATLVTQTGSKLEAAKNTSSLTGNPLNPSIDGNAVMRKAQNGPLPSPWRVFRLSRWKLLLEGIGAGLLASILCLALVYFLPPLLHMATYGTDQATLSSELPIGLAPFLFCILRYQLSFDDSFLILLPEGFVKGVRHKATVIVNFKDAMAIETDTHQKRVLVTLPTEQGEPSIRTLDTRYFQTPQQVGASIVQAYHTFQTKYRARTTA